ncbi:MAG TPA: hypothetical protein VIO64_21570 [Pseudobacteroides sp.]
MDATWIIPILAGALAALYIGYKVKRAFKNGECGSCRGSCSSNCKKG